MTRPEYPPVQPHERTNMGDIMTAAETRVIAHKLAFCCGQMAAAIHDYQTALTHNNPVVAEHALAQIQMLDMRAMVQTYNEYTVLANKHKKAMQ